MRPPDCYVCHLTLRDVPDDAPRQDHFTLVYFGATEEAKMAPSRAMAAQERAGHPYNAIWFCNEDLPLAREHENRPSTRRWRPSRRTRGTAPAAVGTDPKARLHPTPPPESSRPEGGARGNHSPPDPQTAVCARRPSRSWSPVTPRRTARAGARPGPQWPAAQARAARRAAAPAGDHPAGRVLRAAGRLRTGGRAGSGPRR